MASTYSSNLRFELIGAGEQAGTWGTTTNTNLGTLIEGAIAKASSVSVTSANQALTYADGAADQARVAILRFTTTTAANFAVYAPPVSKLYVVSNESAYQVTIYNSSVLGNTTAAGAGVAVPAGKVIAVWSNGTGFFQQTTHIDGLTLSGTPTAPTAVAGTNTTQIATTAHVFAERTNTATLTNKTLTSPTINTATITGGTISGITDLAIADGGTGASTAANARTNLGLDSGYYTPSVTGLTNISSVSSNGSHYQRINDIVFVSGSATVTTTSSGSFSFYISVPIPSVFGTAFGHGMFFIGVAYPVGRIVPRYLSGGVLVLEFQTITVAGAVSGAAIYYTASYTLN